jgi:predicted LPLAT superfamily acyltransferase
VSDEGAETQPNQAAWLQQRERGSSVGLRATLLATRVLGRRLAQGLLAIIAFYFTLFSPRVRVALRGYHRRLDGNPSWRRSLRHVFRFCQVTLDRMYLLTGRRDLFEVERIGTEHMFALMERKQGAMLLGAHLGSFEVMRAMSRTTDLKINILAHSENAKRITHVLEAVSDGEMNLRVIEIMQRDPSYILEVKERIDDGELVAILGDRVGLNERFVEAEFLGEKARFPSGPYLLASLLRCPVLTVCGLFEPPKSYRLHCEPFAERVELPRGKREEAMAKYAQQYAGWLEGCCRRAPENWFNFFDFWSKE